MKENSLVSVFQCFDLMKTDDEEYGLTIKRFSIRLIFNSAVNRFTASVVSVTVTFFFWCNDNNNTEISL